MARPIPKAGTIEDGYRFKGGNPKDPAAWEPLTGTEYLKTLSPKDQGIVKALIEGRSPFPGGARALATPLAARYVQMANQADPEFDAASFPARVATRKDFTSGNSANNIRSLNQALGHLNGMMEAAPQVAGHSGFPLATLVNAGINWYEKGAGQAAIQDYNASRTALAGELATLFKGKGASSEEEVKKLYDLLSDSNSTEQKRAVAKRLGELMGSRLKELGDQYTQGMGTTAAGLTILNPDAARVYENLKKLDNLANPSSVAPGATPITVGQMGQQPQQQAAPQANPTDALLKKYGL